MGSCISCCPGYHMFFGGPERDSAAAYVRGLLYKYWYPCAYICMQWTGCVWGWSGCFLVCAQRFARRLCLSSNWRQIVCFCTGESRGKRLVMAFLEVRILRLPFCSFLFSTPAPRPAQ